MCRSFTLFGMTLYPYALLLIAGAMLCFVLLLFVTLRRHKDCLNENLFALVAFVVVALLSWARGGAGRLLKWGERGAFELRGATFYGGLLCALALYPLALLLCKNRRVPVYTRPVRARRLHPRGALPRARRVLFRRVLLRQADGQRVRRRVPRRIRPVRVYGGAIAVHPTQLYEAAFLLALFFVLFFWLKKDALPFYCILYGAWRFGIEFLRADDRGSLFGLPLSPSQVISVALFILGGALLAVRLVRARRGAAAAQT